MLIDPIPSRPKPRPTVALVAIGCLALTAATTQSLVSLRRVPSCIHSAIAELESGKLDEKSRRLVAYRLAHEAEAAVACLARMAKAGDAPAGEARQTLHRIAEVLR